MRKVIISDAMKNIVVVKQPSEKLHIHRREDNSESILQSVFLVVHILSIKNAE